MQQKQLPEWIEYYKAEAQWKASFAAYKTAHAAIGVDAYSADIAAITFANAWAAYEHAAGTVGVSVNCSHQWEEKPLFTGNYHKCLLCGEEQ